MIASSLDIDACFHMLSLPDGRLVWDSRQQLLTLEIASEVVVLNLERFARFEKADLVSLKKVATTLMQIEASQSQFPAHPWRQVMGLFAFLLLRLSLKRANPDLQQVAEGLLRSLGPDGKESAWRVRYDGDLSYENRYRLLDGARRWFVEQYCEAAPGTSSSSPDVPDKESRESYWWTVHCQYELASERGKAERYRDPAARLAFVEAAKAYLNLLKDEPRTQDLERFLRECGSGVEKEVKDILFSGDNQSEGLLPDETVQRVFGSWFLKRDDLLSAAKLSREEPGRTRPTLFVAIALVIMMVVVALFVAQTLLWKCTVPPHSQSVSSPSTAKTGVLSATSASLTASLTPRPSAPLGVPAISKYKDWRTYFSLQLLIQVGMLVFLIAMKPELHRILVPRAFYAALLAWLTIIPATVLEMHSLAFHDKITVGQGFHDALQSHGVVSIVAGLAMLLLLFLFIWSQMEHVTYGITRLKRTVEILAVLYFGALFWGLIFGLPIKLLLERQFEWEKFSELVHWPLIALKVFNAQPRCDCYCIFPIVFIGSSIAVYFGVLVKLLWEDKSLSELLSEPL